MATARKAAKRTVSKTTKVDNRADLAAKAASAITAAIAQSKKGRGSKAEEAKMTVHVHIGDVIMMGFDEAVDAEEWGMRENNTEIIGGKRAKSRSSQDLDADALAEKNRKISRSIKFKKGSLELNASENSEPAKKRIGTKKPASKKTRRVATKRKTAKRPSRK